MTQSETLKARAGTLSASTSDAYSFDNYGERGWYAATLMLLKRGYTDREAEAILRSKWTRWAADMSSHQKRYGTHNGATLARFLDSYGEDTDRLRRDVDSLVAETFGLSA